MNNLATKKSPKDLLVLVATGYEDVELVTVVDLLSRANITYDLASVENKTSVFGTYNAHVATTPLSQVDASAYRGVFLPGGGGTRVLLESAEVKTLVQEFAKQDRLVTAICAAPAVLLQAGVLDNKVYTAHPDFAASKRKKDQDLVQDGRTFTGRDMSVAYKFGLALADLVTKERSSIKL